MYCVVQFRGLLGNSKLCVNSVTPFLSLSLNLNTGIELGLKC